jgi:hypothetical protein
MADYHCRATLQLKNGSRSQVICQEAASAVRRVEVTAELSQHYVALCPVKTNRFKRAG